MLYTNRSFFRKKQKQNVEDKNKNFLQPKPSFDNEDKDKHKTKKTSIIYRFWKRLFYYLILHGASVAAVIIPKYVYIKTQIIRLWVFMWYTAWPTACNIVKRIYKFFAKDIPSVWHRHQERVAKRRFEIRWGWRRYLRENKDYFDYLEYRAARRRQFFIDSYEGFLFLNKTLFILTLKTIYFLFMFLTSPIWITWRMLTWIIDRYKRKYYLFRVFWTRFTSVVKKIIDIIAFFGLAFGTLLFYLLIYFQPL